MWVIKIKWDDGEVERFDCKDSIEYSAAMKIITRKQKTKKMHIFDHKFLGGKK